MNRFIFITLPLLLLFFACSRKDPVVARVGKERITLEEYKTAYLEVIKQPNAFDSRALREQFLDELIERRLLAREAEKLGMAADEQLQYRIQANRDKNLRDAHFRKRIRPLIRYDQNDLERTYAWMNEERHLKHLFSPTQAGADSLRRLLEQGAGWDDLARTSFDDVRLAGSGGDLGWVGWEQMEFDLANAAFNLPLNTPSQPVASSYGWHLLQVVDWRKTPLLSQAQYELQKNNARAVLEQKLGDKHALVYVSAMMKQKKIQLYPKSLRAVGQKLGVVLQRQPSTADQLRTEQLTDAEMGRIASSLWEVRHEPLASIDGEILTVGEFIAALTYVPYHAVHRSMKSALDFVLRDRALTREARTMGLERDPEVRIKTDLFAQNRLQMARRLSLLADIRVDDADLQRYYTAHHAASNPGLDFAEVKELLVRDALAEKRAQTMAAHLQQLRSAVKISRNPAPIHAWYDDVLNKK